MCLLGERTHRGCKRQYDMFSKDACTRVYVTHNVCPTCNYDSASITACMFAEPPDSYNLNAIKSLSLDRFQTRQTTLSISDSRALNCKNEWLVAQISPLARRHITQPFEVRCKRTGSYRYRAYLHISACLERANPAC